MSEKLFDAECAKNEADKSEGRLSPPERPASSLQKTEKLIYMKWLPRINEVALSGGYCTFFGAIDGSIDLQHAAKFLRQLGFSVVINRRSNEPYDSSPASTIYIGWDEIVS